MKKSQALTNKDLIEKLIQNDPTALRCIYEAYSEDLLDYFIKKHKAHDKEELSDHITDALIKLVDNPTKFNPGKSSLKTYLIRDIEGDILNSIAKVNRAKKKLFLVELSDNDGNIKEETSSDSSDLYFKVMNFFKKIFKDERDIRIAWMMEIDKERASTKFARILETTSLPIAKQKAEVKKHKDRIQKKLNREGWKDFLKKLQENA